MRMTPATVPDERFHRVVTDLLEEWARVHLPGFEALRIVGEEWSARSHEIRDLLGRNGIPFGFYPADTEHGKALLEQAGVAAASLPVIILFDGQVLETPSNTAVAEALGVKTRPEAGLYDMAVIGAGPAGLAAAVYGASEGLSTVMVEPEAIGGQAGTSSRIRNYLGFPTGWAARIWRCGPTRRPGISVPNTSTGTRPPACASRARARGDARRWLPGP